MARKPLDEKYFTAEELAEIKALQGSPEVKLGEKIKESRKSPEAKARAKARQRLYYLRRLANLGRKASGHYVKTEI